MVDDRKPITVRLSAFYRTRIKEVIAGEGLPDVHSESDLIQDALWLWFHEHDLTVEQGLMNGKGARTPLSDLGAEADRFQGGEGLEMGEAASPPEGGAGDDGTDQDPHQPVVMRI